jgi:hypothetical protein
VRRIAALLAALATGAAIPHAAEAQSLTAGGSLTGRLGYGSNPYLTLTSPGGSGVAGGNLTGWLANRSETSVTRLTGVVDIDQNFQYYGRAENYQALLDHQQTISDRLSVRVGARYSDAINPRNFQVDSNAPPTDLLSIGQRSRNVSANGTVQWAPTSRDSFYVGPQYSHSTYPNSTASSYDSYGVSGGYLRQVNAKMKVGIDLSVQKVNSQGFANSTSYQGGVRLVYDFSPIWQFDGNVGLIHQTSSFGSSSSTPGFSASLCGKYPRYNVCVQASRQSAASGFGGLRTDNRVGVNAGYDLSSRSHVRFAAVYDISQATGISTIPTQKYWEISGGYSRTISTRLSGGFSGRYQNRNYGNLVNVTDSTVTGYAATLDVTYKFGRIE